MTLLFLLLVAPLFVANLVFMMEVASGLRASSSQASDELPERVAVIIPAHDEESGIGEMLGALLESAGRPFSIVLVADNCRDDTAGIARKAGVEVLERSDPTRRGKGYALAFAQEWLRKDPPQVVVILDADCRIDGSGLRRLAATAHSSGLPCQAVYLMEPAATAGPLERISAFAFLLKNLIRQRGLQRIAGSVHLTGSGMSMPWPIFDRAELATASIVEDVRLGLELTEAGTPPRFVEGSVVLSAHADREDALEQRSRWEGGFISLTRTAFPRLAKAAIRRSNPQLMFRALDYLVPPLALLALVNVVALAASVGLAFFGVTSRLPALLLLTAGAIMTVLLLAAWWAEGRRYLQFGTLLRLPFYALWKIPMYLAMARRGAPSEWRRTRRPGE